MSIQHKKSRLYKVAAAVCITSLMAVPLTSFAAAVQAETVAETEGTNSLGWFLKEGSWYYYDNTVTPATGWRQIDGKYYYFNSDGTMASGKRKEGETLYIFAPETGNAAYAKKEKNTGGGSFTVGFYEKERQELTDNLNELKEDFFDSDVDDDYYQDEKVNYDKDASFIISGKLTEIAEHRLAMARTKGYGDGAIPGEGDLDTYVKSIRYNSGRRFMEVYLKNCENADEAEQKLLRSHGNYEKRRKDRAVYYTEMGIARQTVDEKDYYMVVFMK